MRTGGVAKRPSATWEAYVAADDASLGRLELLHGEMFAMAGGTPAHALVILNLGAALHAALRGSACRATSSDQRVALPGGDAAHPDVTVWCGTPEFLEPHTLANPVLVAEVLSPTTEAWDRGGKLELYRGVPSIRHVLLVAHDTWHVALVSRRHDGSWTYQSAGRGGHLALDALDVVLAIDDVYAGVTEVGGPSAEAVSRRAN